MDLFKKENISQLLLVLLFTIYLIAGYNTPEPISTFLQQSYGKATILLLAVSLFMANPVLGIVGVLVALTMIQKSNIEQNHIRYYTPSEPKKNAHYSSFNNFPYTLEQEVIKQMAPLSQPGLMLDRPSYKPKLDHLHNATTI
jgi:hypothetical protein